MDYTSSQHAHKVRMVGTWGRSCLVGRILWVMDLYTNLQNELRRIHSEQIHQSIIGQLVREESSSLVLSNDDADHYFGLT